jgi:pimeloyl-ACP methyl ester carboxylesterase
MPVSHHFIEVAGIRTHYLRAGEAGPPLFLLHGGGTDSAALSWGHIIEPLAKHFRIFAPDWPGYGESERPAIRYTMDFYIRFLGELMTALDIPAANLAGVSMGGGIALGFALRSPERVHKLVLVDSYGLQPAAPSHKLSYFFIRLPWVNELTWAVIKQSRELARLSLQNIFYRPQAVSDELVDEVFAELRKPRAGRAFISFQKDEITWRGLRTVYMDRLHELRVPTLIIHGANDRLVPLQYAQEAHRRIHGSRLYIIPECGHWPQREKPEEFNRVLLDFLLEERADAVE